VEGDLVEELDVMRTSFGKRSALGTCYREDSCSSSDAICAKTSRPRARIQLTCGSISNRCLKIRSAFKCLVEAFRIQHGRHSEI